jgi:hypothetical protein
MAIAALIERLFHLEYRGRLNLKFSTLKMEVVGFPEIFYDEDADTEFLQRMATKKLHGVRSRKTVIFIQEAMRT